MKTTIRINHFGGKCYFAANDLHREDGPAQIWPDGNWRWRKFGLHHRDGGPSSYMANGTYCWMQNGKIHNELHPSFDAPNGHKEWYRDDNTIWPKL